MTPAADERTRWIAFFVVCTGTLMIVLDTTIVNVALPSIRVDLGFSETSLVWVVNAYLLTFGGFLLLGGRLGDLYGHRRLFIAGLVVFTSASLACGLATSQPMLIAARAVQGLGGALVDAISLSLVVLLFESPSRRAKAMGVYGLVCAAGGSVGVLLGGLLTQALSWHWVFLVNVPIGLVVAILASTFVPTMAATAGRRGLDVAGALTVTVALMLAVYAVVDGHRAGWTSAQTIALGGGVARPARGIRRRRVAQRDAADAAAPVPSSPGRRVERDRRAVGGRHVRVVLHLGALPAAACSATTRDRSASRSCRRT